MNKLLQKVAKLFLGLSLAAGVGVAIGAGRKGASLAQAAENTRATLNTASTTIATSNSYANYTETSTSYHWAVTCGSKQSAGLWLGSNSTQKAKMTLGNGSISGNSGIASAIGVATSATYYAAIIQTAGSIANVDKVTLTYTTPGGTAPSEAWVLYSTDSGSTWTVFQKVTSLSTSGTNFTHAQVASARYAFVIHASNYCQFKVPVLTFKGTDAETQTISGSTSGTAGTGVSLSTNATSSTSWTITANTCGATLSASTGTSITVNATSAGSVTVQATCSGYTTATHTIEFASAAAETITVSGPSSMYVGDAAISLTATPSNFAPTSYTWLSSNTGVATVSGTGSTGTVSAVAKGTTNITASATGTNGTVVSNSFTVTVKQFSIALSTASVSMKASKSTTVTVTPTDATGTVVVTAVSANNSIASTSVSGTTITITSGSEGETSTTITVSAKDNGGTGSYHTATSKTISVTVNAGYTVGAKVTSLPEENTLVYLIADYDGTPKYFSKTLLKTFSSSNVRLDNNSSSITTDDSDAALFYLSSTGTLRFYDDDTDSSTGYIYNSNKSSNGDTQTALSSTASTWASGMSNSTYPGLLQLSYGRFLSLDGNNYPKAYASNNLGSYTNVYAYLAVASTPTVALSGDSVTGLKGNPADTSLTLTISNFTATGLNVTYKDDGESSFSASSDVATVTCGHTTGSNTVSVSFDGVGSTTVKLSVTRGSGDPIEKTFTVSVSPKPASITINNTLKNGYLEVRNSNSASTYGYQQLDITALDTEGNAYEGQLDYTVESGDSYIGLSDAHRVYGKAVGTGVVKVSAHALSSVYAEVNVKSMDDTKTGVKSVTFNSSLTANAGDALSISNVIATKKAYSYFGYSEGLDIDNSELLFSYSEDDYENAVPAASFIYACDEETAVDDSENQTVYVYCTLDSTWSSSFSITVTQTSNAVTGVAISNVSGHAKTITRTDSFQLTLAFTPSNATNKNVTYSLSNQSTGSTITVSQTGLVSAGTRAGSTARVTVTTEDGGFTDYVDVTVAIEEMEYTVSEPLVESFDQVTEVSQIVDGDYLFVAKNSDTYYFYDSSTGADNNQTGTVTVSDGKIAVTDTLKTQTFAIAAMDGGYSFKNKASTSQYISASNVGSTSNGTTKTNDAQANTIVASSDGAFTISSNSHYLQMNYNNGTPLFRYYRSTSANYIEVLLFKLNSSGGDSTKNVDATLLNAVLDNFGAGKTYEWSESCPAFHSDAWEDACDALMAITGYSSYKLNRAVGNIAGNEIEVFIAKYDNIIIKFGTAYDHLGRYASGGINYGQRVNVNPLSSIIGENTNTVAIIVIISIVSVTAIGGYFFLKKRKENN